MILLEFLELKLFEAKLEICLTSLLGLELPYEALKFQEDKRVQICTKFNQV